MRRGCAWRRDETVNPSKIAREGDDLVNLDALSLAHVPRVYRHASLVDQHHPKRVVAEKDLAIVGGESARRDEVRDERTMPARLHPSSDPSGYC